MSFGIAATSIVGLTQVLTQQLEPTTDSWCEIHAPGQRCGPDAEGHVAALASLW